MKNIITTIVALSIFVTYPIRLVTALDIVITDNGSGSSNEVNVQSESNQTVTQSNTANIDNNVAVNSNTGGNTASQNSGDVAIVTGDSSQEVVVVNSANNSSVDIENCCQGQIDITIAGNGDGSVNNTNVTQNNNTNVVINQNTNISNNVSGKVNTGNNVANQNNGNVNITTGNISVAGSVKNGPINIHDVKVSSGGKSVNIAINQNGVNSSNNAIFNQYVNDSTFIFNNANILNNIFWDLNTGNNIANGNNGDVNFITGDIDFSFFIDNGPINFGTVEIGDCCIIDDPNDPSDPDDPNDPSDPNDPGNPIGGTVVRGHVKDIQAAVYSAAIDAVEILGLSDTSSATSPYVYWIGVILMATGLKGIQGSLNKKRVVK